MVDQNLNSNPKLFQIGFGEYGDTYRAYLEEKPSKLRIERVGYTQRDCLDFLTKYLQKYLQKKVISENLQPTNPTPIIDVFRATISKNGKKYILSINGKTSLQNSKKSALEKIIEDIENRNYYRKLKKR